MLSTIKVPFDRRINSYLVDLGYTHLLNKGTEPDANEMKNDEDFDYILIPLRPGDPAFNNTDMAQKIEDIKSNDVYDMADGEAPINFIVQLPLDEYNRYNK